MRAAATETLTRRHPTLASLPGAVNTAGGEGIAAMPYLRCGRHYDEEKRKPDVTTADTVSLLQHDIPFDVRGCWTYCRMRKTRRSPIDWLLAPATSQWFATGLRRHCGI